MTTPRITDAARKAAGMEILNASAKQLSDEPELFKGQGRFVQLAINSVCAEKDKEIERLIAHCTKLDNDCMDLRDQCRDTAQIRDTLLAENRELRSIAKESVEAVAHWKKYYESELDRTELEIKSCSDADDLYGVNFHQGKRGGIITHDIGLSKFKDVAARYAAFTATHPERL